MHVALCLFRYFPHGGMQRDLMATARSLRASGHEVTVYCHTWEAAAPPDLAVAVLPTTGRSNHARAQAFGRALAGQLPRARPDVVVGFDKVPGLDLYFAADPCYVARAARKPWPYRLTPRYRAFAALEEAVFGPRGARVLLLDDRERAAYRRAHATAEDRFVLLPPGVARDRRRGADAPARRARCRRALGLGDEFVLLLLASNPHLKGLDRALRGLAALPADLRARTRLLAVGAAGHGPSRRAVARLGLGARCHLLPGRDDVPDLLQAADLLVHPARRDTTGTVLLEAVVSGLPALCTAACGYAPRVQAAGAGVVLPEPFDQRAFDRALRSLRTDDLAPLQQSALRYADEVDLHGMHDRIVAEVERAAETRRRSR